MTVRVSQILQKPRESNPAPQIISGLELNENIENSTSIIIKIFLQLFVVAMPLH